MSKRVLILVEGQTEERFVKDVLGPAFLARQLFITPTLLVTKRVKNGPDFKGGVTTFGKFQNDAKRLLSIPGGALVTTLLDYYGLPEDFPGMKTRPNASAVQRVTHVERAIAESFGAPDNFTPFLALHEFEAWLFSSPVVLPGVMSEMNKMQDFTSICESAETPEDINERTDHTPSKRIKSLFPAYRKTLHGPITANRIGLDRIRSKCPHFDAWISSLETFASA